MRESLRTPCRPAHLRSVANEPRPEVHGRLPENRLAHAAPHGSLAGVNRLCIFVGVAVFGLLGGLLAGRLGLEAFSLGGFLLSGLGSMVGVYVGWRIARRFD